MKTGVQGVKIGRGHGLRRAEAPSGVLVVGGGPAGLAVAGSLLPLGIRPVVLEAGPGVGWAWRRQYPSLRLHTTRRDSSLPGWPMPGGDGPFAGRDELVRYLERYAERFDVDVRVEHAVRRVRRGEGSWEAETGRGTFRARHLVIATGANRQPVRPSLEGEGSFGGPVLHSAEWKRLEGLQGSAARDSSGQLRGLRVLVAGLGNTGADLVEDLARRGARVTVAQQGPVHLVPRSWLGLNWRTWYRLLPGAAFVAARGSRMLRRRAPFAAAAFWSAVQRLHFGDLEGRGLRLQQPREVLDHWNVRRAPLTSGPFVDRIRSGEVPVLPGLVRLHPGVAEVVGGRRHPCDAVVLATGFRPALDDLLAPDLLPGGDGGPPDGRPGEHPGLWFCGFLPELLRIRRSARRIAAHVAADLR